MGQKEKYNIFSIVVICGLLLATFLISYLETPGDKKMAGIAKEVPKINSEKKAVAKIQPPIIGPDNAMEIKEKSKAITESLKDNKETEKQKTRVNLASRSDASRTNSERTAFVTKEETKVAEEKIETPSPQAIKDQDSRDERQLNTYVLNIIKTYQVGQGKYPYLLNNDYQNYNGVTATLSYQDKVLLKAHPSGNKASHCVGITFEVFFKAMQQRNRELGIAADDFNSMTWDELFDFAMNWYAASNSKKTNNLVIAGEKYGIGQRVRTLEQARPGDFIDFSRDNNTGHTAVFLNWIKEGDNIIGLKYWSSQESTGGINYKEEYFNASGQNTGKYGNVIKESLLILRILPVSQYKSIH